MADQKPSPIIEVLEWIAENWFGILVFIFLLICVTKCALEG